MFLIQMKQLEFVMAAACALKMKTGLCSVLQVEIKYMNCVWFDFLTGLTCLCCCLEIILSAVQVLSVTK